MSPRDPLTGFDAWLEAPYQREARHDAEDAARAREDGPGFVTCQCGAYHSRDDMACPLCGAA